MPLPVGKNESSDDDPLAKLNETDLRAVQDELREKASNPYHRVSVPRATIIKINSIRDVRRESTMSTFDGRRRVYIISPADAMGEEAANTLLKTLEEPSGDCMLILATSRRDALLPTILSRCQNVRFDPLTEADLMEALIERNSLDRETAGFVARLANGSYTAALGLLAEETLQERAFVPSFVRHVLGGSVLPLIEDVERFAAARDRVAVERFLAAPPHVVPGRDGDDPRRAASSMSTRKRISGGSPPGSRRPTSSGPWRTSSARFLLWAGMSTLS